MMLYIAYDIHEAKWFIVASNGDKISGPYSLHSTAAFAMIATAEELKEKMATLAGRSGK